MGGVITLFGGHLVDQMANVFLLRNGRMDTLVLPGGKDFRNPLV